MTVHVDTAIELAEHIGQPLGRSDWVRITQADIDAFARLTGDDHWIHIDVERASREMPQGRTIAHGFLVLSLIPRLQRDLYSVKRRGKGLNYGSNRVRFTSPVPVDSRVRLHQTVKACERQADSARITFECTMEIEGVERPALVAETLVQIFDEPT